MPEISAASVVTIDVIEYAVRYCMSRASYAFVDGLDLAEAHWGELSRATRDDVKAATRVHGFPMNDARTRWPKIYTERYPEEST